MTAPVPAAASRTATRPSSVNTRVLGGLLLVFGSGWMLKQTGVIDLPWGAVGSIVLIALGLALVITARSRARSLPLIALGGALTIGLAIGSSNIGMRGGFGERTLRPATLTTSTMYRLGVGELVVDLRSTAMRPGTTTVRAEVSVGHLLLRVPPGVALLADVDAKFGNAVVLDKRLDVHGRAGDRFESDGYGAAPERLHLVLRIGAGQIDVEQ